MVELVEMVDLSPSTPPSFVSHNGLVSTQEANAHRQVLASDPEPVKGGKWSSSASGVS